MMYECHYNYKNSSNSLLTMSSSKKTLSLTDQKNNFYFKAVKKETTKVFLDKINNIFVYMEGYLFNKNINYKDMDNGLCESELIAKLYIKNGIEFIKDLDGFFCILIFDQNKRRLFAFNDHIGSESIFYHKSSKYISITSDINILRNKYSLECLDNERIYSFFEHIHASGNETFFDDIFQINAFEYLNFACMEAEINSYGSFNSNLYHDVKKESDFIDLYNEIFTNSVSKCIETENYKVATALSGGLDSSTITSKAAELNTKEVFSFTASFDTLKGRDYLRANEKEYSNAVAKKWSTSHHIVDIKSTGPISNLKKHLSSFDEPDPFVNGYMHENIFSEVKKNELNIFLDGYGGDSIISHGYNYYHELGANFKLRQLFDQCGKLFKANNQPIPYKKIFLRYFIANIIPEYFHWIHKTNFGEFPQQIKWAKRLRKNKSKLDFYSTIKNRYGFYPYRFKNSAKFIHEKDVSNKLIGYSVRSIKKRAQRQGIDIRFPFLNKAFIELSINTPVNLKIKNGINRYIFRESFKNILPTNVYSRITKSDLSPLSNHEISKIEVSEVKRICKKIDSDLFDLTWIENLMTNPEKNIVEIYQLYSFLKWSENRL